MSALLASSVLAVPLALLLGTTGSAAAEPLGDPFGSHVSGCAQLSTGFSGQHNPSHHRGPGAHDMSGLDC